MISVKECHTADMKLIIIIAFQDVGHGEPEPEDVYGADANRYVKVSRHSLPANAYVSIGDIPWCFP
jgi:hypothetical protein